jgi:hypothetical protein
MAVEQVDPIDDLDLDIENISTPVSFAPGVARKLCGARPSKTRSPSVKSCTIAAPVVCA